MTRSLLVGVLAAVLVTSALPFLQRQAEQARRAQCLSNLHALWQGMMAYAEDNHGWLPAVSPLDRNGSRTLAENGFTRHAELLLRGGYVHDPVAFLCPSDKEDGDPSRPLSADGSTGHVLTQVGKAGAMQWFNVSYFYVAGFTKRDRGDFLLLADEHWDSEGDCPAECRHNLDAFDNHGKAGRNVIFLDGRAEWMNGPQIDDAYHAIQQYGANYRTRTVD